jgi:hypothetical protein
MMSEGLFPWSEGPAASKYPELDESNPFPQIIFS